MTTAVTAYDDVDLSLIPANAPVVFYYTDGRYKESGIVAQRFPHATLISIAVNSNDIADCLDVEPGDAGNPNVYSWLHKLPKPWHGPTKCPVIYTSVSNVNRLMLTMNANRFVHGVDYLIWSAHYGLGAHICGPTTCKATGTQCDATQWTDRALGKSLDQTMIGPGFLSAPVAPKYPAVQTGTVHSATTGLSAPVRTTDGGHTWVYAG